MIQAKNASAHHRLAFLDAARGIAVLLVLVQHGLGLGYPPFAQWTAENIDLGRVGVLLFLCISGFIIPQSLEDGGFNPRFWIRRFFRLFPAYWLAIGLGFAYAWFDGRGMTVPASQSGVWLINLTMLQGFFKVPHVWHIFWTLHLEMIIYLTFWVLAALRLLKRPGLVLGSVLGLYLGYSIIYPLAKGKALILSETIPFAAAWLGFALHAWSTGLIPSRMGASLVIVFIVAPLLVAMHNYLYDPIWVSDFWWRYYLINHLSAYLIFLLCMGVPNHLAPRWLTHLGRISYSIYLSHPLILLLCFLAGFRNWELFALMTLATLALSECMFRCLEAPAISLGKRWEERILGKKDRQAHPKSALQFPLATGERAAA